LSVFVRTTEVEANNLPQNPPEERVDVGYDTNAATHLVNALAAALPYNGVNGRA
jgi:hypothetical protein